MAPRAGNIIASEIGSVIEMKTRTAFIVGAAITAGLIIGHLLPVSLVAQSTADFNLPDMTPPPPNVHSQTAQDKRLREQIVKDDAEKNIRDTAELLKLATDLKAQMSRDGGVQYVPAQETNETKRIEKLAKDIRAGLNKDVRDIHF
jgi:hypothetical protein